MGVIEKYILYDMLYRMVCLKIIHRGMSKSFLPLHHRCHELAFERANYILAAIRQSISEEEIGQAIDKLYLREINV